ncbi:MAG: hemerythrin domain-containing protein [Methanomassiliicoccales archaeon]
MECRDLMQPHGILLTEHRVIEKALRLMAAEKAKMDKGTFDPDTVWALVDFISVIGDELHHGKEETILFPALKGKARSFEFEDITTTLMREHADIRRHLRVIREAMECYVDGDEATTETLAIEFGQIVDLYSRHVKKEDSPFFETAMSVLTEEEKERMMEAMIEYDRSFALKRYERMIDDALKTRTK